MGLKSKTYAIKIIPVEDALDEELKRASWRLTSMISFGSDKERQQEIYRELVRVVNFALDQ